MSFIIVWDSFVFSCLYMIIISLVSDYRAIGFGIILLLFYFMVFTVVNLFFKIILKFIKLPIYLVIFLVSILSIVYISNVIPGSSSSYNFNVFYYILKDFKQFFLIHSFFLFGITFSLLKNCTKISYLNRIRFNFKMKLKSWSKFEK